MPFLGDDREIDCLGPSENCKGRPHPDFFLCQKTMQVVDPSDGFLPKADDHITLIEPGPLSRTAGFH